MNAVFAKIKLDNNTDFALSRVIKGETGTGSGISKETYLTGKEAFENGISWPHERHNLLFSAALYLKFKGMSYEQCSKALSDWMNEQDETVITTPKSRWQEDVDRVVKDVYSGRYVNDNTGRNVSVRVTRNLLGYIYKNTNTKVQRVILLLMAVNHMKFTDHLEDGGFRFSTSQIQTDTEVSWDSAKKVPLQLADMGLIKRETGKTSKNPIVKAASLFGKPPTWYKVNDDLANLIHETISAKASAIEISDNKPLYGQMNYALHSLFEEYELKEMLKKDAYKTSDRDYKDFCLRYKTW